MKFQLDFTGKRVLVTGSTMGIGYGAAEAFHGLGATVAVNGRSAAGVAGAIERLGGGRRLVAAPGDVASSRERQEMVDRALDAMGGLDVLVNNAGRGDDALIDQVTEEYWQKMTDLNLKAVFFTTQACLPALKQSRGVVINVSSVAGIIGMPAGVSVYAATKAGVVQMTRMLSLALAKEGVRVNALCPGWIDTPMIRKDNEKVGGDGLLKYINESVPMGRIGTVEECTGALLYLAAPFAGYTTGSVLVADGGLSAGH
jgi:NAD(P)-dependent dehydrogenase (short-subunit alcohol dehydrogenase family)